MKDSLKLISMVRMDDLMNVIALICIREIGGSV